jgi:hypothetical protein
MRLLHTTKFVLEEFVGDYTPPYAILSHRWHDGEILYRDFDHEVPLSDHAMTKPGYSKVQQSCRKAREQGHEWIWIDTFCIDKSSSAELSESINSMFRWYQEAEVCYAYLQDVDDVETTIESSFAKSIWWSRGWTLQELIAPAKVEFYNREWHLLGTKNTLLLNVSKISGIAIAILHGAALSSCTVAQRMAWAACRKTTKVEDMAYCLMGLFDVNMPMLYGEGSKAFLRLQREIMEASDDHSIFAWELDQEGYHGLLAPSPHNFRNCDKIRSASTSGLKSPFHFTNMGLKIELTVCPWDMDVYLAALDCTYHGRDDWDPESRIGIYLALLPEQDQYARICFPEGDRKLFDARDTRAGSRRCRNISLYIRQDSLQRTRSQAAHYLASTLDNRLGHASSAAKFYWQGSSSRSNFLYGFVFRDTETGIFDGRTYLVKPRPDGDLGEIYNADRDDFEKVVTAPIDYRPGTVTLLMSKHRYTDWMRFGFDTGFNLWIQDASEQVPGQYADNEMSLMNDEMFLMNNDTWMNAESGAWVTDRLEATSTRSLPRRTVNVSRERIDGVYAWVIDIKKRHR